MMLFLFELAIAAFCTACTPTQIKATIEFPWFSNRVIKSYKRRYLNNLQDMETQLLQEMCHEIKILSQLDHANIIKIDQTESDCEKEANSITFAKFNMKKYPLNLNDIGMSLNLRAIIQFPFQMTSALTYLHDSTPPIAHRDIKFDNIYAEQLFNDKNREWYYHYVLADFGYAIEIKKDETNEIMTNQRLGTEAYAAPELFDENIENIDAIKTDIYSLGICIGLMLKVVKKVGNRFVYSQDLSYKFKNVKTLDKLSVYSLSDKLKGMVYLMTQQDPQSRPTASQLYDFLELNKIIVY
eukprot:NODE_653_length_4981_cov_0.275092.p3 type:complete len:297 gc:universal NODE_653_length_4981_cov_0.275092:3740-4630(+)